LANADYSWGNLLVAKAERHVSPLKIRKVPARNEMEVNGTDFVRFYAKLMLSINTDKGNPNQTVAVQSNVAPTS